MCSWENYPFNTCLDLFLLCISEFVSVFFFFLLQLNRGTKDGDVAEKIVVYQHANKEVIPPSESFGME